MAGPRNDTARELEKLRKRADLLDNLEFNQVCNHWAVPLSVFRCNCFLDNVTVFSHPPHPTSASPGEEWSAGDG